jgi:hypothetical protein
VSECRRLIPLFSVHPVLCCVRVWSPAISASWPFRITSSWRTRCRRPDQAKSYGHLKQQRASPVSQSTLCRFVRLCCRVTHPLSSALCVCLCVSRLLRQLALQKTDAASLGDTSTLMDPTVVEVLKQQGQTRTRRRGSGRGRGENRQWEGTNAHTLIVEMTWRV